MEALDEEEVPKVVMERILADNLRVDEARVVWSEEREGNNRDLMLLLGRSKESVLRKQGEDATVHDSCVYLWWRNESELLHYIRVNYYAPERIAPRLRNDAHDIIVDPWPVEELSIVADR